MYVTNCILVNYIVYSYHAPISLTTVQVNSKVIHRKKKLFWNVSQNC